VWELMKPEGGGIGTPMMKLLLLMTNDSHQQRRLEVVNTMSTVNLSIMCTHVHSLCMPYFVLLVIMMHQELKDVLIMFTPSSFYSYLLFYFYLVLSWILSLECVPFLMHSYILMNFIMHFE
jgi:hypothetical protein